ncbi:MAG TPA: acyl-CoA dehydrogenase family protein [Ktedonobacteraceae bacterium]|nr:acyl-CoA dehydrogenase family protein [Ktedonobacteraceae bacterium]
MVFSVYPATEDQKRIVALAGELADTFAKRASENEWAGRFPYENYRDLHEAGYLKLTVPRELGGEGANVLEVALAQARLAQGCPSTALITTMHLTNIVRIGAGAQSESDHKLFERICHEVVEQGALINNAASEPATGSPSRGGHFATTARRQADGSWLINGHKNYTTGSAILHFFLITCSLEDDAPAEANLPPLPAERASLLVTRDTPGVRVEETWNSLGMRLSASHDLLLENVHVGPEALTTALSHIPADIQGAWGLPLAAIYLGIGQGARNAAVNFAKNRRPNSLNQPISSVPHIQEKVAKMDLALLQVEALLFGLAEQCLRDPSSIPAGHFAAAKYLATNHASEVTDLAMRLVGGAALSLNLPLQRYYRDIRAGFNNPPMDDVTLGLLSKEAFEGMNHP